jgi:hypothetical protein
MSIGGVDVFLSGSHGGSQRQQDPFGIICGPFFCY